MFLLNGTTINDTEVTQQIIILTRCYNQSNMDLIILLGAQGSGKTTIARLLKEKLNCPYIDFDWIRDFHLDSKWSNTNLNEQNMSFDNLCFIVRNYLKHGYSNIILSGFSEDEVKRIIEEFKDNKYKIVTLILNNDEILKERVLDRSRDSGYRDYKESISFNKRLKEDLHYPNEIKIDNTNLTPELTASKIESLITSE